MTVQPPISNRMSSAHTAFRLPNVEWGVDRTVLARPHRRLVTAKLRREWLLHKYGNDAYRSNMTTQLQRSKTFTSSEKKPNSNPPIKCYEPVAGANNVWQNDILSRKLPERIPIVRPIRIQTAPPRTIITDTQRDCAPFFEVVPSATRTKTELSKERGRMHFIDREWPSEKVSWIRFYRNVPEIHRRSWME